MQTTTTQRLDYRDRARRDDMGGMVPSDVRLILSDLEETIIRRDSAEGTCAVILMATAFLETDAEDWTDKDWELLRSARAHARKEGEVMVASLKKAEAERDEHLRHAVEVERLYRDAQARVAAAEKAGEKVKAEVRRIVDIVLERPHEPERVALLFSLFPMLNETR